MQSLITKEEKIVMNKQQKIVAFALLASILLGPVFYDAMGITNFGNNWTLRDFMKPSSYTYHVTNGLLAFAIFALRTKKEE